MPAPLAPICRLARGRELLGARGCLLCPLSSLLSLFSSLPLSFFSSPPSLLFSLLPPLSSLLSLSSLPLSSLFSPCALPPPALMRGHQMALFLGRCGMFLSVLVWFVSSLHCVCMNHVIGLYPWCGFCPCLMFISLLYVPFALCSLFAVLAPFCTIFITLF